MRIPNKYMLALRFCVALSGKIIGIIMIGSAIIGKKDSANLIVARRRYRDAIRRYNDSVLDAAKEKFNAIFNKIKATVKEYIKAFPTLSRLLVIVLTLDSLRTTAGVITGAPKVMEQFSKIFKEIDDNANLSSYGKAGLKARGVLLALFYALKQITKSIIKFKAANAIAGTLVEKS